MPRRGGSGFHGSVSSNTLGAWPRAHIACSGGKNKSLPGKPELKDEMFRWFAKLTWSNQAGTKPARILLLPKIKTRVTAGSGGKTCPFSSHCSLALKTISEPFFRYGKPRDSP